MLTASTLSFAFEGMIALRRRTADSAFAFERSGGTRAYVSPMTTHLDG